MSETHGGAVSVEDLYLARLRGAVGDGAGSVLSRLEALKGVYVRSARDDVLDDAMRWFLVDTLAASDGLRTGSMLVVSGESGSGKSRGIRRMLREQPALEATRTEFGHQAPIVSISLDGPSSLTVIAMKVLAAAGYPVARRMQRDELWLRLPELLRHRGVLVVHVDEMQHVARETRTGAERRAVANSLKGLLAESPWPVSLILSGLPEIVDLARSDEQVERRSRFVHLPDISYPENAPLVAKVVRELCAAVGVDGSEALTGDLPGRLAHAARYRTGRLTDMVRAGLVQALSAGSPRLGREHLSAAYRLHSHARLRADHDLFLAPDWASLPSGYFLLDKRQDP